MNEHEFKTIFQTFIRNLIKNQTITYAKIQVSIFINNRRRGLSLRLTNDKYLAVIKYKLKESTKEVEIKIFSDKYRLCITPKYVSIYRFKDDVTQEIEISEQVYYEIVSCIYNSIIIYTSKIYKTTNIYTYCIEFLPFISLFNTYYIYMMLEVQKEEKKRNKKEIIDNKNEIQELLEEEMSQCHIKKISDIIDKFLQEENFKRAAKYIIGLILKYVVRELKRKI